MTTTPSTIEKAEPSLVEKVDPIFPARSWLLGKKIRCLSILDLMTLILTFSSTGYSSSSQHIIQHFRISYTIFVLGLNLFVLGFAIGPFVFGPSVVSFGKRPTYVTSYTAFAAFSFGASEANWIAALLVCKFFVGIFGSSSLNNVPASMGDLFVPDQQPIAGIFYVFCAFAGLSFGPVISSFVNVRIGCRWNLRVQAIFVSVNWVICLLFVPETAAIKARDKNAKFRVKTFLRQKGTSLISPFVWLCTDIVVLRNPLRLLRPHPIGLWRDSKMGERERRLDLPLFDGCIPFRRHLDRIRQCYVYQEGQGERQANPGGGSSSTGNLGGFVPSIGLVIFAWTAPFTDVHWIRACLGIALFSLGAMTIFTGLIPYLVIYGGPQAPVVMAAGTMLRAAFGAVWPLFIREMADGMRVQGCASLLAGVTLLLAPLPYIFSIKGKGWREGKSAKPASRT